MSDPLPPSEYGGRPMSPPYHSPPGAYPGFPWSPQQRPGAAGGPGNSPLGSRNDLVLLRGAYRTLRRVATVTALGYFTLFLVLSAFAPSLMTSTVSGGLSTGLLLGLIQVPVTCLAIVLYEYTARRRVDPLADRIRERSESHAGQEATR